MRKRLSRNEKAESNYPRAEKYWRRGRSKLAFPLFLAAARAGFAEAFGTVAQFYDYGSGVKANENEALYWYRRAYRHGDPTAANNIACILRDRGKLGRALDWFERAVKRGDDDANLNIAKIYLRQRPNVSMAIRYLERVRRSDEVTEGSQEEAVRLLAEVKTRGKA